MGKVVTYRAEFQADNESWEKEKEWITKRKNTRDGIIRGIAKSITGEDQELFSCYYFAYKMAYKRVPARDLEDVIQEIITAYIEKQVKEEFMYILIAKEKVTQYYRRGRIAGRNYRNILLTKQYYYQNKQGNTSWYSKYQDGEEEQINYDIYIEENGEEFEEVLMDKLLIDSLPKRHKELAYKRFFGEKLTDSERASLSRYQRKLRESIL